MAVPRRPSSTTKPAIASSAKRRRSTSNRSVRNAKPNSSLEIVADEDDALIASDDDEDEEVALSADEVEETPDEKRVRIAKAFLDRIEHLEEQSRADAPTIDSSDDEECDHVQARLKQSSAAAKGVQHHRIAASITSVEQTTLRGHRRSATCVDLSADDRFAYSAAKDGSWISWDIDAGKKLAVHDRASTDELLAIAASPDGTMLATAGRDKLISLWDLRTSSASPVHVFKHHRDAVSSLAWRRRSTQLFSGSLDRTVGVWDVDARAYVDSLFGHQSFVTDLATLNQEKVLSSGLDGSVRLWKVADQTQLVYRARAVNVDAIAMLSETQFISGDQDRSVCIWRATKKKAALTVADAHCDWIASVGACAFSDLAASGSSDGRLRLWQVTPDALLPVRDVPVVGFVNAIRFARTGRFVVCAIGQEPKLGRWRTDQAARNGLHLVALHQGTPHDS